jgi:probable F420-dependent oxidoreductase
MGTAANASVLRESARRAEAAGLDAIWVPDHIAIPPDDAEGSGGRYLDPLTSLAWLAAATERIRIGTSVLILPYRPPLPTAKAIATIQELSDGRLELGVGVGWMDPEFRAVGVDRHQRGRITDQTLTFLREAFDAEGDIATSNGQPFLFRPNPTRPRIWIGGAAPHALDRAARLGDGWMALNDDPKDIEPASKDLHARFSDAGRGVPEIAAGGALGRGSVDEDMDRLDALDAHGVTEYLHGARYDDLDGFVRSLDLLMERVEAFRTR